MNTTETIFSTGFPATAPQPTNNLVKPFKFPAQPQEWKIVSLRECPTPETMQQCETPDQAAAYWKTHIPSWWYSSSTRVGVLKVTIWCPLGQWIQSSVIPGKSSVWQSWPVPQRSSSRTIIRAANRHHPRQTSKSPATSSEQANFLKSTFSTTSSWEIPITAHSGPWAIVPS